MTPERRRINAYVAHHLREALSWASKDYANVLKYRRIRLAKDHDTMVFEIQILMTEFVVVTS